MKIRQIASYISNMVKWLCLLWCKTLCSLHHSRRPHNAIWRYVFYCKDSTATHSITISNVLQIWVPPNFMLGHFWVTFGCHLKIQSTTISLWSHLVSFFPSNPKSFRCYVTTTTKTHSPRMYLPTLAISGFSIKVAWSLKVIK